MSSSLPPLHRVIAALSGLALVALGHGVLPADENPSRTGSVVRSSRLAMGTLFEVSIWAPTGEEPVAAEAALEALERISDLEKSISSWDEKSETTAINHAAGGEAVAVSPILMELLSSSLRWARHTEGAFDVTGGPLFELWEHAREDEALPSEARIRSELELVGHGKIELGDGTVRLASPGMKLGFGAVGKGFAADVAARFLRSRDFPDFIIDAGGDLVGGGTRGGTPWTIAVRHPRRQSHLATIEVADCSIATSGDYERHFMVDDVRYSHIVDLRTGWPVRSLTSVTVIAPRGVASDALATALSVMEVDDGLHLVEGLPEVEALLVEDDGTVRLSSGLSLAGGYLMRAP